MTMRPCDRPLSIFWEGSYGSVSTQVVSVCSRSGQISLSFPFASTRVRTLGFLIADGQAPSVPLKTVWIGVGVDDERRV